MSADLHIYILQDKFTERDVADFFAGTFGSKHFDFAASLFQQHFGGGKNWDLIDDAPNVWIGEVSWLKAMVFDDRERFVPNTVQAVSDIIGEDLPVIDDALIARVREAFSLDNGTDFDLANVDDVCKFLETHRGKRAFTVSV